MSDDDNNDYSVDDLDDADDLDDPTSADDPGLVDDADPADPAPDLAESGVDDLRFGASTPAGVDEAGNTVTWSDSFHGYYDDKTWEEQVPK